MGALATRLRPAVARSGSSDGGDEPRREPAVTRESLLLRGALLLAAFAAAFGFGYVRQIPAPSVLAAGPEAPSLDDPRIALWHAAGDVETRLDLGGAGLTFTATQIQLLRPEPGGPELLLQPDRDHPDRAPTPVDQFVLGSLSGRGSATPDSFFAEWFNGTDDQGLPTFEGEVAYTGLVHDGELWRRDERSDDAGLGWVAAPDIPGFGVDPASLRELPELLRRLQTATYLGVDADGHHWSGQTEAIWYPGAVAVDGAAFTGSQIAIELWLDGSDRLVGLFAVARNINEPIYQLLCINRLRFEYAASEIIPVPTEPQSQP